MSILFVPSLHRRNKMIEMRNISLEEAKEQMHLLNVTLALSKDTTLRDYANNGATVVDPKDVVSNLNAYVEYSLIEDLECHVDSDPYEGHGMIDPSLKFLVYSDITHFRGLRCVYLNFDSDTIIVGTTVVYNKRQAAINVVDDSIPGKLLDFVIQSI